MTYNDIVSANFISRPNRFIAYVELGGKKMTVLPPQSEAGRLREIYAERS